MKKNMKRLMNAVLVFATVFALLGVAHADLIYDPDIYESDIYEPVTEVPEVNEAVSGGEESDSQLSPFAKFGIAAAVVVVLVVVTTVLLSVLRKGKKDDGNADGRENIVSGRLE